MKILTFIPSSIESSQHSNRTLCVQVAPSCEMLISRNKIKLASISVKFDVEGELIILVMANFEEFNRLIMSLGRQFPGTSGFFDRK